MNFGEPDLDIREPIVGTRFERSRLVVVEGDYQLFVDLADWTLDISERPGATSECTRAEIDKALGGLDGQKLERVVIASCPTVATFEFDLGAVLSLTSYSDTDPDDDLWHIFHGGMELALQACGDLVLTNLETNEESRCSIERLEFVAPNTTMQADGPWAAADRRKS